MTIVDLRGREREPEVLALLDPPSGLMLDLTREQFVSGERLGEPSPEQPLTHRSPERLATLRARVRACLELD